MRDYTKECLSNRLAVLVKDLEYVATLMRSLDEKEFPQAKAYARTLRTNAGVADEWRAFMNGEGNVI